MTKVADLMTRGVNSIAPNDTMVNAARIMGKLDVGAVPVCAGDLLVGIVTDRDIAVRRVAEEKPLHITRIEEVMTTGPSTCTKHDDLETAVERMKSERIRRLPVVDMESRLVGMLSLADVALKDRGAVSGSILADLSEPTQPAPNDVPDNAISVYAETPSTQQSSAIQPDQEHTDVA